MHRVRLELISEPPTCLRDYAGVAISFEVKERVDVDSLRRGARAGDFETIPIERAYVKDYDQLAGQRPVEWADRWNLSKWWFAAAFVDGVRVGGVAVVIDPSQVDPAAGADAAILWDIRIRPDFRGRGIGAKLLALAEEHVRASGLRRMIAETQDINVGACRFYARAGYGLSGVNPSAYPQLPDEVQLIWQKNLD
jgi:GNAT superfamily N-acetyltransferase